MCIVLDINILGPVFDTSNIDHGNFKPVFDWIFHGKGKIVFGGTKYYEELSKTKYVSILDNFRKARKVVLVSDNVVDKETSIVSKIINHKDFNDQHLVGLIRASACLLICSKDKKSYPFLTNSSLYKPPFKGPKIYSSSKNKDLLADQNIANICKPCYKTTNNQRLLLSGGS